MTQIILTPKDPRWDDFTTNLITHLSVRIDPDTDGWESACDGTFRITRNLFANRYMDIDVEATIAYFRENLWFCDCDVVCGCPHGLGTVKKVWTPAE